jgi:uncharacterized protein YggE
VKSTGTAFKDVQAENEKKAKAITDALTALKIDSLVVRTAPMDVQMQANPFGPPPFGPPPGGIPPGAAPAGPGPAAQPKENATFTVTNSFTVEIKNADQEKLIALADRVLSAAVTQGANTGAVPDRGNRFGPGFNGGESGTKVEFYRTDASAEREKATKAAVAAALSNAKAAAGGAKDATTIDVKIKDVTTLTDQPNNPFGLFGGLGGGPNQPDAAGETDLTVTVSVTCTF